MIRALAAIGAFLMILLPAQAPAAGTTSVAALNGDWAGTLDAGVMKFRLVFHIRAGPDGATGTLDSIDQAAMGMPLSSISRDGQAVRFDLAQPAASFHGALGSDGQTLVGQWSQGGADLPLALTLRPAGAPEAKLNRPQT